MAIGPATPHTFDPKTLYFGMLNVADGLAITLLAMRLDIFTATMRTTGGCIFVGLHDRELDLDSHYFSSTSHYRLFPSFFPKLEQSHTNNPSAMSETGYFLSNLLWNSF
jgi:hypothetical protein